jgi:hypothetical protein
MHVVYLNGRGLEPGTIATSELRKAIAGIRRAICSAISKKRLLLASFHLHVRCRPPFQAATAPGATPLAFKLWFLMRNEAAKAMATLYEVSEPDIRQVC